MGFEEFKAALIRSVPSGRDDLASDRDIHDDYESYLALVELSSSDGEVIFYQDSEGQTRLGFRPTPVPRQMSPS